jgi:hypothetical protein
MSQHYSNPDREDETYALPDVETFTARYGDCPFCTSTVIEDGSGQFHCEECRDGRKGQGVVPEDIKTGWFYWYCFPGCLPEGDPIGPFETEDAAIGDMRERQDY